MREAESPTMARTPRIQRLPRMLMTTSVLVLAMLHLVLSECATRAHAAKILKHISVRDKTMHVCFSPFKCDEALDELDRKMERSHFRFGNFPLAERTCISQGVRKTYENVGATACVRWTTLERTITKTLGDCIDGIKIVRDAQRSSRMLRQQGRQQQSPVNASAKDVEVSEPSASLSLETTTRTAVTASAASAAMATAEGETSVVGSARAAVRKSTEKMPYGSPIRKVARLMKLENVSERQWTYECSSGKHWCCVFIGDDQAFSCFGEWCRESNVADLHCY